jgi:hypothetical protein
MSRLWSQVTILFLDTQLALDPVHFDKYWAAVDIDRYGNPEEQYTGL